MRQLLALVACFMLAASPLAYAQDKDKKDTKKTEAKKDAKKEPSAAQKKQQERMAECNEKAGKRDLKGDERKKFMSACLRGEDDKKGEKMTAQQEKMKACNKQASDKKMKGDDRKKFMSECLKG